MGSEDIDEEIIELLDQHNSTGKYETNNYQWNALHICIFNKREDTALKLIERPGFKKHLDVRGGEDNSTPLMLSVKYNLPKVFKKLIKYGAKLGHTDKDGNNEWHYLGLGSEDIDEEIIELLDKHNSTGKYETNNYQWNALHIAIINKNIDTALKLIEHPVFKEHLDVPGGEDNSTPLMLSVKYNLPKVFEKLIEYGATLGTNKEGSNEWHYLGFGSEDKDEEIIKLLDQHNSTGKYETNNYQWNALHIAIINKNIDTALKLIEHPGFKEHLDVPGGEDNSTPLMLSVKYNLPKVFKKLIEYGATRGLTDKGGNNEWHYLGFGSEDKDKEIIQLLDDNCKTGKYETNNYQWNALHECIRNKHEDTALNLLKHGFAKHVNTSGGEDNSTPLMLSVKYNLPKVFKKLIEYGATLGTNKDGSNEWHYLGFGSEDKDEEIIKLLDQHNSTGKYETNNYQWNALHVCIFNKREDTALNLLKHGFAKHVNTSGGEDNSTPLMLAVESNLPKLTKTLIKKYSALVNCIDSNYSNTWHYLGQGNEDKYSTIIDLLDKHNSIGKYLKNYSEEMPIHVISCNGFPQTTQKLISLDKSLIDELAKNETPAMIAVKNNHFDVLKVLIENGTDTNIDIDHLLQLAIKENQKSMQMLILSYIDYTKTTSWQKVAIVEIINEAKVDISFKIKFLSNMYNTAYCEEITKHFGYLVVPIEHVKASISNIYYLVTDFVSNLNDNKCPPDIINLIIAYYACGNKDNYLKVINRVNSLYDKQLTLKKKEKSEVKVGAALVEDYYDKDCGGYCINIGVNKKPPVIGAEEMPPIIGAEEMPLITDILFTA